MTQEEKELLLTDLTARLRYRVCARQYYSASEDDFIIEGIIGEQIYAAYNSKISMTYPVEKIKPYLRPMLSMTEEELGELLDCEDIDFDGKSELVKRAMLAFAEGDKLLSNALFSMQYAKTIDWLNAHHFDYRGLIEKDLAIEAPKDMYK